MNGLVLLNCGILVDKIIVLREASHDGLVECSNFRFSYPIQQN
jgi:hypothetical protein